LPEQWKADRAVISAAFKYKRATFKDIPILLLSNEGFLRQSARDHPHLFSQLPPKIRNDIKYWLAGDLTERLVVEILHTNGRFVEDRQFWLTLLNNKIKVEKYVSWINEYAPQAIQLDHKIMLHVINKDPERLFKKVDNLFNDLPILHDEAFMRKLFENLGWFQLDSIPVELLLLYPHLVAEILIPRVLSCSMERLLVLSFAFKLAYCELWDDGDIVKAWFSSEGKYVDGVFPETWDLDPKVFLWIAENCEEDDVVKCFEHAPEELLDDKSFMMQVIRLEPKLYQVTSKPLQNDMELSMMVCSMVSSMDDLLHCGMSADNVQRTLEHAQERYNTYHSFDAYLSCVSNPAALGTPITLLNQGPTAALAYHSLVDACLNVPTEKELQLARLCVQNIAKPCDS
jgi:hypothetical protein